MPAHSTKLDPETDAKLIKIMEAKELKFRQYVEYTIEKEYNLLFNKSDESGVGDAFFEEQDSHGNRPLLSSTPSPALPLDPQEYEPECYYHAIVEQGKDAGQWLCDGDKIFKEACLNRYNRYLSQNSRCKPKKLKRKTSKPYTRKPYAVSRQSLGGGMRIIHPNKEPTFTKPVRPRGQASSEELQKIADLIKRGERTLESPL